MDVGKRVVLKGKINGTLSRVDLERKVIHVRIAWLHEVLAPEKAMEILCSETKRYELKEASGGDCC